MCFDHYQWELLFKIIVDKNSVVAYCNNKSVVFWVDTLFENTAMVVAMNERLNFQSYVLEVNRKLYRLSKTKEARI